MSAAAEVHMCISGEGDEDEDGEGGEDKYEYDFGGIELMMEDDKAKVHAMAESLHRKAYTGGCRKYLAW